MEIINMSVMDIRPYEKNPRFNDDAVEAVAKSIKEFGFRQPLVVDQDMVLIVGHSRLKAALKLGLTEVPVHIARDLTPEQIQAYRIADNKTAELAEWNYDLLPLEIRELQDADFDLSLLGFDEDELDKLLNGGDDKLVADGETEPDAVPELPDEPVSRAGEVYQLGDHLLVCGDATNAEDYVKLMGEDEADLYLTDPPYNVAVKNSTGLTIMNDDMENGAFRRLLDGAFTNAKAHLKPGGSFYIWHSDSESVNFRLACEGAELPVHQTLYWVKNALVLGRFDYQMKTESCLYGWRDGAAHNWYSDRSQSNVLEFSKAKVNPDHPTPKNVEMLVYMIQNSTQRGETVLDNFGGSGSTLIACEQTGRKCRMLELDPKYADVIRRRWAEFKFGEGCDWAEKTPLVRA